MGHLSGTEHVCAGQTHCRSLLAVRLFLCQHPQQPTNYSSGQVKFYSILRSHNSYRHFWTSFNTCSCLWYSRGGVSHNILVGLGCADWDNKVSLCHLKPVFTKLPWEAIWPILHRDLGTVQCRTGVVYSPDQPARTWSSSGPSH